MKFLAATGAGLLALAMAVSGVSALETAGRPKDFAKTYGQALPPVGFVEFCGRSPENCRPIRRAAARVDLTAERWGLLAQVNSYVNAKIAPVSDQDLYGKAEYWTIPSDAGDCEDYLLLKKKYLEGLGFPAESLLITVVLDEKNEGHAILTVASKQGDFILDNRRDQIVRWSDANYRFLKRQSSKDPRQWVALTKQAPASVPSATETED
jgi:predicted transglutaminase-like cysteine proteinase